MKKNLFDRNLKIEINTDNKRLTLKEDKIIIAGPCAIESYDQLLRLQGELRQVVQVCLEVAHTSQEHLQILSKD